MESQAGDAQGVSEVESQVFSICVLVLGLAFRDHSYSIPGIFCYSLFSQVSSPGLHGHRYGPAIVKTFSPIPPLRGGIISAEFFSFLNQS
jgi:hypothetical protein